MDDNSMHEEEIATFEALTNSDRATAAQYLESCGWCVEDVSILVHFYSLKKKKKLICGI